MLLTQLFSGLIAAVVIALGAGQNGNNKNTQVGEELVVEETVLQEQPMYWYATNENGTHTVGEFAYQGTKSDVIGLQPCKDGIGSICLFGTTDSDLPENTPVGTPPVDERINRNN